MTRGRIIVQAVVLLVVIGYGAWLGFKWGVMRVYVPHDKALLVINKFGKQLPPDLLAVPRGQSGFKGVQEDVRGPGRYFLDPIRYDWKLVDQVVIPAGDPHRWEFLPDGTLKDLKTAPMVGLVSSKQGKAAPPGQEIVEPGFKGIQRQVLTPGTYKINPQLFEVTLVPAVVVPPGSVGVVTSLVGEVAGTAQTQSVGTSRGSSTQPAGRLVAAAGQRGILENVLQPGIYYLNPRIVRVDIVPVGYDQITLDASTKSAIMFYSSDGYQVDADFTVVWGRGPADAPMIIANIGNVDLVQRNVIEPAMKAACQNVGAKYTARELIQGTTREDFQRALTSSLEDQVAGRNVHILLAMIRGLAVKDSSGKDATGGLLATIQRANIEVERELTNRQKTQTAMTTAKLEEALKLVDVARETVASETNVKVANILAQGQKKAAEIDAQRDLNVAEIALEIAQLEAQRTRILGQAQADVARLRNDAEARGAKLMVDALGTPQAYNLYTFAREFAPTEIRLIFAGPGTFWTDLKNFEAAAARKLLEESQPPPAPRP